MRAGHSASRTPASIAADGDVRKGRAHGGDRVGGVLVLVAALQARQRQVEKAARVLVGEPPAFLADVEIAARDDAAARARARPAAR